MWQNEPHIGVLFSLRCTCQFQAWLKNEIHKTFDILVEKLRVQKPEFRIHHGERFWWISGSSVSPPRATPLNKGKLGTCLTSQELNPSLDRLNSWTWALAGVAQWIEWWPVNQGVAGSIPSQGTSLGCWPGTQLGVWERQPIHVSLAHWCFSPFLFPSHLSKNK